jgi:hypothetical protein
MKIGAVIAAASVNLKAYAAQDYNSVASVSNGPLKTAAPLEPLPLRLIIAVAGFSPEEIDVSVHETHCW